MNINSFEEKPQIYSYTPVVLVFQVIMENGHIPDSAVQPCCTTLQLTCNCKLLFQGNSDYHDSKLVDNQKWNRIGFYNQNCPPLHMFSFTSLEGNLQH